MDAHTATGEVRGARRALSLLLTSSLYVATAKLGLGIGAVSHFATLIWPPTGIALAALVIGGMRLWPAIALGAFVANVWTGAPPVVALGIAVGNTLEAVVGAYVLRRRAFRPALDRLRDVFLLIGLAAVLSTLISATIGVSSLWLGGLARGHFGETWRAWWGGDLIGDLVIAPVLLVWSSPTRLDGASWRAAAESAVFAALLVGMSLLAYGGSIREGSISAFGHSYVYFPMLLWATLRFGPRGGATTTFLISAMAVWQTAMGFGPFVRPDLHQTLLALQTFMSVVAGTALVLGASVAERRRSVEIMRESEARKTGILEASLDGIITIDHHGIVLEFNPAAERTFGYRRAAVVGQDLADLIIPARLRDAHRRGLARYLGTGEGAALGTRLEFPACRADGTEFPVEIAITVVRLGSRPPLFTAHVRDITERKRAEADRAQLLDELEEAVRARDAFISIASHELRTPLSSLQLQVDLLRRHAATSDLELSRVDRMHRQVGRLNNLIANLLDMSRITAGRLRLELEEVDLAAAVREVVARFDEELRRAMCPTVLHAERPVMGQWDELRLEQIVTNLVSNAVKFGAGKVVEITVDGDDEIGRLVVRDHGIGISREDQARIFERFERLVTERHVGGFGLGLWIVRQIVDALGGTIRVEGASGAGTTFTVEIPRAPRIAAPPPAPRGGADEGYGLGLPTIGPPQP